MRDRLQLAIKEAMRAKDKVRMDTLRGLTTAIQYEQIQKGVTPLPEPACIEIIQREVKKRRESLDFAKQAARPEMVERNEQEIKILQEFLPKQLSLSELESWLQEFKKNNAGGNLGMAMKGLKEAYAGQYDGKAASDIARRLFAS